MVSVWGKAAAKAKAEYKGKNPHELNKLTKRIYGKMRKPKVAAVAMKGSVQVLRCRSQSLHRSGQGRGRVVRSMVKDLDDEVQFQQQNPKRFCSEPYRRYAPYSRAKTVREALYLGTAKGDIAQDESKRIMIRCPKRAKERRAIMNGINTDETRKRIVARKFFCFLGIQGLKHRSIEDAQASLGAIDRVLAPPLLLFIYISVLSISYVLYRLTVCCEEKLLC